MPFPGTSWHPWIYLREVVQLALRRNFADGGAIKRYATQNQFNFTAIVEVAVLFMGIFVCMQPALDLLSVYLGQLGVEYSGRFFWASGSLSSVLDNAPTYLVFFTAAQSMHAAEGVRLVAGVDPTILAAISLGSVTFGRDDVHRQRTEFHGQGNRGTFGREDAKLLWLHGLQLRDPAAILALAVWQCLT